jgi:hypothetical protein
MRDARPDEAILTQQMPMENPIMARNEARRQQKLMKKRQKDKVRRKARAEMVPYSMLDARKKIRLARQCPPYECLINASWKDKGLATILISRRQPDGNLLFGVYLVDILCLGVKNTFCNADFSLSRYSTDVVGRTYRNEEPVQISKELAHQLIYGAIRYARQFGFHPHKDFNLSQYILDEADSIGPGTDVEFGRDGKPLFITGPDDDVPRILKQLEATAGPGHFDYLYGSDSPAPHLPDTPGQTVRRLT